MANKGPPDFLRTTTSLELPDMPPFIESEHIEKLVVSVGPRLSRLCQPLPSSADVTSCLCAGWLRADGQPEGAVGGLVHP
jgi:hypothetical protein